MTKPKPLCDSTTSVGHGIDEVAFIDCQKPEGHKGDHYATDFDGTNDIEIFWRPAKVTT